MNKHNVIVLLESLLDRIIKVEETGKYKLEGILSKQEISALNSVLEYLREDISAEEKPSANIQPSQEEVAPYPINTASLGNKTPLDQETILCLDFGTAMSKAFASNGDDENLYDLAVGKRAGQTNSLYAVASSLYIDKSGRVLFGEQAIKESLQKNNVDNIDSKRIDSIKDMICKGDTINLDAVHLEEEFNPTEFSFTKADIVTLYLAYLTDMACSELEERHKSSRYVRRRFTIPVLPPERETWAKKQLVELLARAQVLADSLHDEWDGGLDAGRLKATLEGIRNLNELPDYLIEVKEVVLEPVAAVASRVRNFVAKKNNRRLMMIIDVGAGTIDFALFAAVESAGQGLKFFLIPESPDVLRQAGDAVDKALRRYVLMKANIEREDHDYHLINTLLVQSVRLDKEELFNEGEKIFRLENDMEISVTKQEFVECQGMQELQKAIHEKFDKVLKSVDLSWITNLAQGELDIVFTGGGSRLPIITSLGNGQIKGDTTTLICKGSIAIPSWVKELYPELEKEYPSLAVAIGGCSRDLPQVAPESFQTFGGEAGNQGKWVIKPEYKGS